MKAPHLISKCTRISPLPGDYERLPLLDLGLADWAESQAPGPASARTLRGVNFPSHILR